MKGETSMAGQPRHNHGRVKTRRQIAKRLVVHLYARQPDFGETLHGIDNPKWEAHYGPVISLNEGSG